MWSRIELALGGRRRMWSHPARDAGMVFLNVVTPDRFSPRGAERTNITGSLV